ncbi:unnamed protein product [Wuchereria bancrofti]|uniref:Uncharacterized protein n=1 Tax=Wuchereria bancrofti TaxID=6293 RepID=A0A3P7E2R2_WUCBA|nr:unnamed protein product [Wuchereria bancrofti]
MCIPTSLVVGKYTAEPKMRPSAIGHFFSRIGSTRHRSKSPRDPSLYLSDDAITACPTQPAFPASPVKNVNKNKNISPNLYDSIASLLFKNIGVIRLSAAAVKPGSPAQDIMG